jgi:hypothetical protein
LLWRFLGVSDKNVYLGHERAILKKMYNAGLLVTLIHPRSSVLKATYMSNGILKSGGQASKIWKICQTV